MGLHICSFVNVFWILSFQKFLRNSSRSSSKNYQKFSGDSSSSSSRMLAALPPEIPPTVLLGFIQGFFQVFLNFRYSYILCLLGTRLFTCITPEFPSRNVCLWNPWRNFCCHNPPAGARILAERLIKYTSAACIPKWTPGVMVRELKRKFQKNPHKQFPQEFPEGIFGGIQEWNSWISSQNKLLDELPRETPKEISWRNSYRNPLEGSWNGFLEESRKELLEE